MKKLSLFIFSFVLMAMTSANRPVHIFMAGDSTMADKDLYRSVTDSITGDTIYDIWPERGWGMLLPEFFNENVKIDNRAKNGRSTRTFIEEGLWDSLIKDVKPGDYVVIQFGHNDESLNKPDRYTPPADYQRNLQRFIDEVREKGATPILCTPVVRRKFDEQGNLVDTHGEYPDLVREVAKKNNVILIDMYNKTYDLLTEAGEEKSKELFMHIPKGYTKVLPDGLVDNTHYVEKGARIVAGLFVDEFKNVETLHARSLLQPLISPAKSWNNEKLWYDFVVASDGSGDFRTVQEAVDAVPDFRQRETKIFIRKGIYKEKIVVAGSKQNVTFIGEDCENTILTFDDYAKKKNRFGEDMGTSGSASIYIYGEGFKAVNITFENTAGPVGQAVACYVLSDKTIFYNCRFLGFQDTLYAAGINARQYYQNCYIEGTTDFIFGSATAWFENCRIHCKKNSYITAANTPKDIKYGYIFNRCTISGDENIDKVYLGRPWRPYSMTVFMNSYLPGFILPEGWHNWNKESNEKTARYSEYNNYGPGASIEKRVNWSEQLNEELSLFEVMKDWQPVICQSDTLHVVAFPGAEGGGMYATGGRGGKTYFVTSLEDTMSGDSGTDEGTLRWCIEQEGAKTILFRIAGIIHLKDKLDIPSNTTIAGQSAPGDGICIADNITQIKGDNVIIRYLRFRMGDLLAVEGDALSGTHNKNVIVDHCSVSWSTDECASFYDNENFTLQWCILSESLRKSVHHKGTHGYGAIWGGKKASFHHNLLAHHDSRNPRMCGSRYSALPELELVDFRNNVIYNWGENSGYAGEGGRYNFINNYYKAGKASSNKNRIFQPNADIGDNLQGKGVWGKFYLYGNQVDGFPKVTNDNTLGFQPNPSSEDKEKHLSDKAFEVPSVTTHSAEQAYKLVLQNAGANLSRDKTDRRIIKEVEKGLAPLKTKGANTKPGLIDSQKDVGGWDNYTYKNSQLIKDENNDGIPDKWLQENYPGKKARDYTPEGYTYLESYLNSLVD